MTIGKANCLICESPLVYTDEAFEVTCEICGKREMGHCTCSNGHHVCDDCHSDGGVRSGIAFALHTDSTNPIFIFNRMLADESISPNGPEHHTLVGAALVAAYANAGGDIDKEAAVKELRRRASQVPGGACGYWGCCGAAISAGQFMSIALKASPLTPEPWGITQKLTSIILGRIAEIGGPRCCKRTGFTAILCAIDYVAEVTGVRMIKPAAVRCSFSGNNAECLKESCPYYSAQVRPPRKHRPIPS